MTDLLNATTKIVPNIINGQSDIPQVKKYHPVHNPSTGNENAKTPLCGQYEVQTAIEAAVKAFSTWSATPVIKRSKILFKYRELLDEHFNELARLICLENGKTFQEACGDVLRGMEMVEFACGISHLIKGETIVGIADQLDGESSREPLGVCAGITPFNFPAMAPMWTYPLAIACGNTFVSKPSEKVPMTANRLAELFQEAGLPPGVLNVVHGGQSVVEMLCSHPHVAAVSFIGSSKVAQHVYRTGCNNGKRVQSAGGAKNLLLVMPDAEMESTVRNIMGAAFGCAGQRCMAGSLLMALESNADQVRDSVLDAMNALRLGNTVEDHKVDMGPVIDGASRDRLFNIIKKGQEEGAELVRDGRKNIPKEGYFVGPTLFDHVRPEHALFREELFGPILSMVRVKSLEQAVEFTNSLPFGNGSSIFTASAHAARKFKETIACGMIGLNVGVPAPVSLFPFAGWNGSFFGDLHVQGMEGVAFYTRQKVVMSRWDSDYVRTMGW